MNQDPYIGREYGIYKIVESTSERSKDGNRIYKAICKECGKEKFSTIHYFKDKIVKKCIHERPLTQEQKEEWFEKNKKKCLYCGEYIPLESLSLSKYQKRKFCCKKCFVSYSNVQRGNNKYESIIIQENGFYQKDTSKKYCLNCGKELKYPTQKKYCSSNCQHKYRYKENIRKWKNGEISGTVKFGAAEFVKTYIKEKYNNQCCKCGWHEINPTTGNVPVEIHHIDGDYQNNKEENLELLCPNCHSLTPTYRALNCGDGRKDRYK